MQKELDQTSFASVNRQRSNHALRKLITDECVPEARVSRPQLRLGTFAIVIVRLRPILILLLLLPMPGLSSQPRLPLLHYAKPILTHSLQAHLALSPFQGSSISSIVL